MEKVNNKNGIDFYYEIDKEQNRFVIYDSSENYFNDLCLEQEDYDTDFKALIKMVENTDLNEMCAFFGHKIYDTRQELVKEQELENEYDEDNILDNDYVNRFVVKDKVYYVFDWR